MMTERRGSVASLGGSSSVNTTAPAAHTHKAHHLKYGDVIASGFNPEDSDDDDDDTTTAAAVGDASSLAPSVTSTSTTPTTLPRDAKSCKWRSMERRDALNRQVHSSRRYLFRRPRALQYFRGTVLVRSEEERSSHRLELFFDLVFVGLIATLAEEAIHEHNGDAIVRYILTYTAAWMVWNYMREVFNAFFVDDVPQRLLVLGVMACLVVYGNNAPHAEERREDSGARATAIGAYLVAGGMVFGIMAFYSFYICQYRLQIRSQALVWVLVLGLWIGSIFASVRACIALVTVALVLEYASWMFFYSPLFKRLAKLRYSSAVAIEHEIDRFTDFVTLVHGEFLYSVLSGQPAGQGMHSGVARVILNRGGGVCAARNVLHGRREQAHHAPDPQEHVARPPLLCAPLAARLGHHAVRRRHRRAGQGERGGAGHPVDLCRDVCDRHGVHGAARDAGEGARRKGRAVFLETRQDRAQVCRGDRGAAPASGGSASRQLDRAVGRCCCTGWRCLVVAGVGRAGWAQCAVVSAG